MDPATWRHLVQPTFPWSAEADEPGRVEAGPSGSQLGTIQELDAALGIEGRSSLVELATAGRRYMPPPHRRFLQTLDRAGPLVRGVVRQSRFEELNNQFNNCIAALSSFRATHQARGAHYLRARQAGSGARASTGLTIGVDDDDPVATFKGAMAERRAETEAAMVTGDPPPTPAPAMALTLRAPLRPRGRDCR